MKGEPGFWINSKGEIYPTRIRSNGLRQIAVHKRGPEPYLLFSSISTPPRPQKSMRLDVAVAENFVKNPFDWEHVIHLDRGQSNCDFKNLAWVESTLPFASTKLTPQDVFEIEKLHDSMSRGDIAKQYNTTPEKISEIWAVARKADRLPLSRSM